MSGYCFAAIATLLCLSAIEEQYVNAKTALFNIKDTDLSLSKIKGNVLIVSPPKSMKPVNKSHRVKVKNIGVNYGWYSMPVMRQRSNGKFKLSNNEYSQRGKDIQKSYKSDFWVNISGNNSHTEIFRDFINNISKRIKKSQNEDNRSGGKSSHSRKVRSTNHVHNNTLTNLSISHKVKFEETDIPRQHTDLKNILNKENVLAKYAIRNTTHKKIFYLRKKLRFFPLKSISRRTLEINDIGVVLQEHHDFMNDSVDTNFPKASIIKGDLYTPLMRNIPLKIEQNTFLNNSRNSNKESPNAIGLFRLEDAKSPKTYIDEYKSQIGNYGNRNLFNEVQEATKMTNYSKILNFPLIYSSYSDSNDIANQRNSEKITFPESLSESIKYENITIITSDISVDSDNNSKDTEANGIINYDNIRRGGSVSNLVNSKNACECSNLGLVGSISGFRILSNIGALVSRQIVMETPHYDTIDIGKTELQNRMRIYENASKVLTLKNELADKQNRSYHKINHISYATEINPNSLDWQYLMNKSDYDNGFRKSEADQLNDISNIGNKTNYFDEIFKFNYSITEQKIEFTGNNKNNHEQILLLGEDLIKIIYKYKNFVFDQGMTSTNDLRTYVSLLETPKAQLKLKKSEIYQMISLNKRVKVALFFLEYYLLSNVGNSQVENFNKLWYDFENELTFFNHNFSKLHSLVWSLIISFIEVNCHENDIHDMNIYLFKKFFLRDFKFPESI